MMAKIVTETEMQIRAEAQRYPYQVQRGLSIPETICESMAHAAEELDVAAIAVFTETRNHRASAFEVSSGAADFRAEQRGKNNSPHVAVVGSKSGAMPENVAYGSDGRHCRATADGSRACARGADSRHGRGYANQDRIDKFYAAAHGWGQRTHCRDKHSRSAKQKKKKRNLASTDGFGSPTTPLCE